MRLRAEFHRMPRRRSKRPPNTTVLVPSDDFGPGLKATLFRPLFRGLKAPGPSGTAICSCSTERRASAAEAQSVRMRQRRKP